MSIPSTTTETRVAVLVDCDNVPPDILEQAVRMVAQFGRVVLRRGYGNQGTLANKWQDALVRLAGMRRRPMPHHQPSQKRSEPDMAESRRILAHVLIEMNPLAGQGAEAIKAALRSAIQVGLDAQVLKLNVYPVAAEDGARPGKIQVPHSEPSDHDQVGEEYVHSGMQVRIYRDAGRKSPPTHYAVVLNPNVKNPSGALIEAKSYAELKQAAETRAERKAFLMQRKQEGC